MFHPVEVENLKRLLTLARKSAETDGDVAMMEGLAMAIAALDETAKRPIFMRLPKVRPFHIPDPHIVFVAKHFSQDKATAKDVLNAHMRDGKDLLLSNDARRHVSILELAKACSPDASLPDIYTVGDEPELLPPPEPQDPVSPASGIEATGAAPPQATVGPPPVRISRKRKPE